MRLSWCVLVLLLAAHAPARAGDGTIPLDIETETTIHSIGITWWIEGDDDLDASVAVRYRVTGSRGGWTSGLPLLRVDPQTETGHDVDPGNILAGSVLFLTPETDYDVELSLVDPDGGAATEIVTARTRHEPRLPDGAVVHYVAPGGGGGSGTLGDPYLGIDSADAVAQPGDVFVLLPGTYAGPVHLTSSGTANAPITWLGTSPSETVLDGGGTDSLLVDVSGTSYVQLAHVTLRNPEQKALGGTSTLGFAMVGCVVDNSIHNGKEMYGVDLRGSDHKYAFIGDNVFLGPLEWENGRQLIDGRHDDHYAVVLVGNGHVVCRNEIRDWWDAVLVSGASDPATTNCDVYLNEIHNCTDDGLETDRARRNIRVWNNRFTNVFVGISAQPVYGGPVYLIRNAVYNFQLKSLKFHLLPSGLFIYHNTFVGANPRGWGDGTWRNVITRNNIFIGSSEVGTAGQIPASLDGRADRFDSDFNGWFHPAPYEFARWYGEIYDTLEDFQTATGLELNATLLDTSALAFAPTPPQGMYDDDQEPSFPPPFDPDFADLRPAAGSVAIDAGVVVAGLTGAFDGTGPDLGAYEAGDALPAYGPAEPPALPLPVEDDPVENVPQPPSGLRVSPNPAQNLVRFHTGGVPVEIYDVAGRRVATCTPEVGAVGVTWDLMDGLGRRVRAGVYVAKVGEATRRFVVVD